MIKFKNTVEIDVVASHISRPKVLPKYGSVGVSMFVKDLSDNELIKNELAQVGWVPEGTNSGFAPPSVWKDSEGFYEFHYEAPQGKGLFNGWTADEEKRHLANLRAALKEFGFERMTPRLRTLAEMM
jgi:hypothetical protein